MLSPCEVSQYEMSRPSWYGKCSTKSGLFGNPKLYGPVFRYLSNDTYSRLLAM